ncbi:MAG TPA: glycosyltransferase, partial [Polyangiales bacterium]|nr:glycosyltransferase [Polyangiales bacterium]
RPELPKRIGILNDYVRVPYANGSSFASQFLFREFGARGHIVSVVGPHDPAATPRDLPPRCVALTSAPLRNHPGVRVPLPSARGLREVVAQRFDLVLGQAGSELLDLGVWLRAKHGVPFLAVNTLHLPSVYNVILPDRLHESAAVRALFERRIVPWLERRSSALYNQGDGLIVLCRGLERYWRERGVRVPIHVIPRAIEPKFFDAPAEQDPFSARARPGQRLLCICRHTREKNLTRLIEIFARFIAPNALDATLTLVGDGPDHDRFRADALRLGVADRVFFPGEHSLPRTVDFYRHADLFVYASLSETYGQVVSEALWCGLPVVALADGMGVSDQVQSGHDGVLIERDRDPEQADWRFGSEVVSFLRHPNVRRALSAQAIANARQRCDPERSVQRYYAAFRSASQHCQATRLRASRRDEAASIVRWASINAALIGFGLLRSPAVVNRHGRHQPTWTEL